MMPHRRSLRVPTDLVSAYETLRAAILAAGDGAATPAHAWRLMHEGLCAWGLCEGATRVASWAHDGAREGAAGSPGVPSGHAPAAVVSLLATLTLQLMTPWEVTS